MIGLSYLKNICSVLFVVRFKTRIVNPGIESDDSGRLICKSWLKRRISLVDFRNLDCIIAKTDLYRLFFFVDAAREKTRGSALAPSAPGWLGYPDSDG